MAREISEGFYWIQGCNPRAGYADLPADALPGWYEPGREVHTPQNAFLFLDEQTLLFDTLSRMNTRHVLDELSILLDGRSLDYLVISHPETPHAGNVHAIRRAYPESQLVAADRRSAHDLYFLEDAKKVSPGDTIDLGRHTVEFEAPVFLDHSVHLWMSERETGSLFTVDWMGFPHMDTECLAFVDELEGDLTEERLFGFHERVFLWFAYIDPARTDAEIDHLIHEHDPSILAPAHGCPIRDDPASYMELMKSVTRRISERPSPRGA